VTGKPVEIGGAAGRLEATGQGVAHGVQIAATMASMGARSPSRHPGLRYDVRVPAVLEGAIPRDNQADIRAPNFGR